MFGKKSSKKKEAAAASAAAAPGFELKYTPTGIPNKGYVGDPHHYGVLLYIYLPASGYELSSHVF